MSLEELASRHRIKDMAVLFIKEKMKGFTLDKVVYGAFNYKAMTYTKSYFIINETLTGVKHTISYDSLKRYFVWRESYLDIRKEYLKINNYETESKSIYEFYTMGIDRSNAIKSKLLRLLNYKKGKK